MESFKQGLNQFWVGAVFGLCLAISLVLIPVVIVMSSINDVLKIHEVSTLVSQVGTMVENTQQSLAIGKQKLASLSLKNIDKRALQKVITTVQDFQLQAELITEPEKNALKEKLQKRLAQELSSSLSEEQVTRTMILFKRLIAMSSENVSSHS